MSRPHLVLTCPVCGFVISAMQPSTVVETMRDHVQVVHPPKIDPVPS